MKKIILLLITTLLFGCKSDVENKIEDKYICMCPHATIYIQPYDNFTEEEVNKLLPVIKDQFDYWLYGEWKFKILKPIPIPEKSFILNKNRYKAIDIIRTQSKNINDGVIIGLTHKDICADVHNIKNYGIVGLSYKPGNSCIVSDKRLKNKSIIWKPILHEFMHAFYGANHCPKDDPKCFMVDAKGKGNFAIENKLCDSCRQ